MKPITESILDGLKAHKQITQVQGAVADAYEKAIEENPKKFTSGKQVMDAVYKLAQEKYKEFVTSDKAIDFDSWWKQYSTANAKFLDATIFSK